MTIIKRNTAPEVQPSEKAPLRNVVDLGDGTLLVKVYVATAQMRTLVGRKVSGIEAHQGGNGRMKPTYEVDTDGKTRWLDKWFAFIVPKEEGVYDLSARATDQNTDEVFIENTHLLVKIDEEGKAQLRRLTYPQLIEHFGGEPLKRNDEGQLVAVDAVSVESV